MYLLDTNTLSNVLRGQERAVSRYRSQLEGTVVISSVTLCEVLVGNISQIKALCDPDLRSKYRPATHLKDASSGLIGLIRDLALFEIVPYTDEDHHLFLSFKASVKRVGSQDCMIAAIALRRGYIVATSNGKDFSQIPNVKFEDWSK